MNDSPIPLGPHGPMTLRDYFAAQAMAGWLASTPEDIPHPGYKPDGAKHLAELSYALADAMMEARK